MLYRYIYIGGLMGYIYILIYFPKSCNLQLMESLSLFCIMLKLNQVLKQKMLHCDRYRRYVYLLAMEIRFDFIYYKFKKIKIIININAFLP